MDKVSLVVHTLNVNTYVQLEYVSQQLFSIAGQEMHGLHAGQRTHHSRYGHIVVDSLYDHLREPGLIPGAQDEGTDELVFHCRRHLVLSARLSQSACEGRRSGIAGNFFTFLLVFHEFQPLVTPIR